LNSFLYKLVSEEVILWCIKIIYLKLSIREGTIAFCNYNNIKVSCGDIFDLKADAIISPANSFGFMDGGIDLAYSGYFGWDLEKKLQNKIKNKYYGEIPVGAATIIKTGNKKIKHLISEDT